MEGRGLPKALSSPNLPLTRVCATLEFVAGREIDEAPLPLGAEVAGEGAAVVADACEGEAALEHGVAERRRLHALRGGAREHLDVAGVLPAASGLVYEAEGVSFFARSAHSA